MGEKCKFVAHPRRGKYYYICTICEQEQKCLGDIATFERACPGYSMPKFTNQAWNLGKALVDFVAEPELVSNEDYEARLKECDACNYRVNQRCSLCGCMVLAKAKARSQHCPDVRWPGDQEGHRLVPGISIGIISSPRENPTLERTINSLRSSGFGREQIFLFLEPDAPMYHGDNIIPLRNTEKLGAFGNYKDALRWMGDNAPTDLILMCEDDVEFVPDARTYLNYGLKNISLEDLGYMSLYTPVHNAKLISDPVRGWNEANLYHESWGALAYLIPKDALYRIQEMEGSCADRDFTVWLNKKGLKTYHHIPSLSKHIGDTSTLGHEAKAGSEPA